MGNALVFVCETLRQPTKKTERSAGYDVKATDAFEVQAFDKIIVGTGVRVNIPHGFYGLVADKSSFSSRTGLFVGAGIIDSDYSGEIKVLLYNPSPIVKSVPRDSVIAQILVIPIFRGEVLMLEPQSAANWTRPTARGAAGFGLNDTQMIPNASLSQARR
jgi:dUTP pyrophosphatase